MANVSEPTEDQRRDWSAWVKERPAHVRDAIERYGLAPWKLYRLKPGGHRVTIYSFDESTSGGVTVTVSVTGEFNMVLFDRCVFGVDPVDLVECDLPGSDEAVGSMNISIEEARELRGLPEAEAQERLRAIAARYARAKE